MSLVDRIKAHHKLGPDAVVGVKGSDGRVEVEPDGYYRCIANTAAIDLDEEVVVPGGCRLDENGSPDYFSRFRTIYLNHNYDAYPGTMHRCHMRSGVWSCRLYVTDRTDLGADTRVYLDEGIIRGTSIGFQSYNTRSLKPEDVERYGPAKKLTDDWLWLELSLTPMPCNPEAMIQGQRGLDDEGMKMVERLVTKGTVRRATAEMLGYDTPKPGRTGSAMTPKRTLIVPNTPRVVVVDDWGTK